MYAIHAHLEAFQTAERLIVVAIALIGSVILDGPIGLIVGATVGYLGILAWHKGALRSRRGPPDEPRV
jgi:hypothetical protein